MATKIILMNEGKVQQVGEPDAFYNRPENIFVAKFRLVRINEITQQSQFKLSIFYLGQFQIWMSVDKKSITYFSCLPCRKPAD